MTAREHLQKLHASAAQHHKCLAANEVEKASHHNALADAHEELEQDDVAKIHRKCAKSCEAAAEQHAQRASEHDEMAKGISTGDLTKADLDAIRPDGVSGVITHFPTAHPRAGAPDIAKSVPAQFAHLVQVEDE